MVFRNGKEILESIVEKTKEDKAFDEKLVLQQTKEDLLDLKEDVSYASVVLEELKKTGWVDQTKFQSIDTKLRSSEHKQEAINEIASVVNDIYERYDNLQVDQKEKVKTMTDALARSKLSLTGLKDEVLKSTEVDYQKIEQELTDEATKKLEKHWYSSWLAPSYKKHIHEKVEEFKLKADGKTPEKSALEKLTSSIRDRFFGLVGGYFIGKSVTDIVEDKIATYKDAALQKGNDAIDKVKT